MNQKDSSFTSLFGKAKKWAQEEIKNATRVGGDPNTHRRAEDAQDVREYELKREAERAAGTAVVETLFPGVRRFQDRMEEHRTQAETDRDAAARARRVEHAGRASVQLSGFLVAALDDLAVDADLDRESRTMFVQVETVDPVHLDNGSFCGFSFELRDYHGDGTYEFVDDEDFDANQFSMYRLEDDEGWFFHPSYGPGRVVVSGDLADVSLVFGSAGSERIMLRAQVRLDG